MKAPIAINEETRQMLERMFTHAVSRMRKEKSYAEKVEEARKEIADMIRKFGGLGYNLNF